MTYESITVNGREFERAGGMHIPSPSDFAGREPTDPVPETIARVHIEIENGALPEGQKVTIQTCDIVLKGTDQLNIDLFDPEDEKMSDDAWLGLHNDRRIRMHLEPSELRPGPNGEIYWVTFPVENGEMVVNQDGRPA